MALSTVVKKKSSSSLLAPGFRFHPTDEELVRYYLRRKVCGKGFLFDAISDVDIYKAEPWDLPSFSKLKSRDLEWYFFSVLDKKYGNGARTNRATEKGYWKTTGKDRAVYHKTQIVGMKKTLVYHIGRAPKGQRTNWVMHEYRLADLELVKAGIIQDAFVLCRVFQKSGSGPKNGEQYGAPFVDEEWENDEFEFFPNAEVVEEVDFGDDAYVDGDDLQQILASADVPYDVSPPLDPKPANGKPDLQTAESINDTPNPLLTASEQYCEFEQQHEMDAMAVKHEHVGGESSKSHDPSDDLLDYLLDEPFVDAPDGLPYSNGGFLEANDLTNPVDNNNTSAFDMLEEYLTFFDAIDNNTEQFVFDPSLMLGTEDLVSDRALVSTEDLNDGNEQSGMQNGFLKNFSRSTLGDKGHNRARVLSWLEIQKGRRVTRDDSKESLGFIRGEEVAEKELGTIEVKAQGIGMYIHAAIGLKKIEGVGPDMATKPNKELQPIIKETQLFSSLILFHSLPSNLSSSSTILYYN
ncbi:NAC domain-containing protein 78 [Striga hermonthica]|uniref:NAC domain-containing protein 78 n=1 Tax=Striga hermonthica TaxID=68872 RepID=A0A9N7R6Y8_STRHE|nr:NAC domain-containing protein 78 [Striga hermonthica]